jgi:hypothetical protein
LFAVTSSITWWVFRPEMAEYMPRIMSASLLHGGCGGLVHELLPRGVLRWPPP